MQLLASQSRWATGRLTGAQAVTRTLRGLGTKCVYGIPGAQANELWDEFKNAGLGYLHVTHEYSAAAMADGYARSTGKPGVLCIVPGPGVTNALTGIGGALLDSVPLVCLVADIAAGARSRPFQIHSLPHAELLRPLSKEVVEVTQVEDLPGAIQRAFCVARSGEPGPAAVVMPYNLLIEGTRYSPAVPAEEPPPLDEDAFAQALPLLQDRHFRVGIYAGLGCMEYSEALIRTAETLQAPVATSISGKGSFPEDHPLSAGWGYGPHASPVAEDIFGSVDLVLAIGVKYGELSTGLYSQPLRPHLVHVDINPANLGRVMSADVGVHADAGRFLECLLEHAASLQRSPAVPLLERIAGLKAKAGAEYDRVYAGHGADPVILFRELDRRRDPQGMLFVDVTATEMWAAEVFTARCPRTFFNPSNSQSMGWSIPAALGAQRVHSGRQVCTITGDGAMLLSGMELSSAARANLPVKFFLLDDGAYSMMQVLQRPAYRRTTATMLARLDYRALARAFGLRYLQIGTTADIEAGVRAALAQDGPVLIRVAADHGRRRIRWLRTVGRRFGQQLTARQKLHFLARIGVRLFEPARNSD